MASIRLPSPLDFGEFACNSLKTQVRRLPGQLGKEVAVSDIEEADIALSCVDTHLQYDKYNRTFHLLDREFASTLEDGVEYELVVPLTVEALNEEDVADAVASLQEV